MTARGGAPPYAYAWKRVTGTPGTACVAPSSSSGTWYFTGGSLFPPNKISTWRCLVTDAASGSTYTPNVTVTLDVS